MKVEQEDIRKKTARLRYDLLAVCILGLIYGGAVLVMGRAHKSETMCIIAGAVLSLIAVLVYSRCIMRAGMKNGIIALVCRSLGLLVYIYGCFMVLYLGLWWKRYIPLSGHLGAAERLLLITAGSVLVHRACHMDSLARKIMSGIIEIESSR